MKIKIIYIFILVLLFTPYVHAQENLMQAGARIQKAVSKTYNPQRIGAYKETPLRIAISEGNTAQALALIEKGEDPAAENTKGNNALTAAIYFNNVEVVSAIIKKYPLMRITTTDGAPHYVGANNAVIKALGKGAEYSQLVKAFSASKPLSGFNYKNLWTGADVLLLGEVHFQSASQKAQRDIIKASSGIASSIALEFVLQEEEALANFTANPKNNVARDSKINICFSTANKMEGELDDYAAAMEMHLQGRDAGKRYFRFIVDNNVDLDGKLKAAGESNLKIFGLDNGAALFDVSASRHIKRAETVVPAFWPQSVVFKFEFTSSQGIKIRNSHWVTHIVNAVKPSAKNKTIILGGKGHLAYTGTGPSVSAQLKQKGYKVKNVSIISASENSAESRFIQNAGLGASSFYVELAPEIAKIFGYDIVIYIK